MEDKKAIEVLKNLLEKGILTQEENEALATALGVLILTVSASESYLKKLKAKKERDTRTPT